jgi:hypothetical protein
LAVPIAIKSSVTQHPAISDFFVFCSTPKKVLHHKFPVSGTPPPKKKKKTAQKRKISRNSSKIITTAYKLWFLRHLFM